jgi:hypothetical protein
MEGFSRPGQLGGEAFDDDEVEGHIMTDRTDDTQRDAVRPRVEDDVEGHGLTGRRLDDDDTEGHGLTGRRIDDDDVEGHGVTGRKLDDDDDAEGHLFLK